MSLAIFLNYRTFLLATACALLSGCASLSADECRTADWRAIGYEDGDRGRTAEYLGKHRKACARVEITPDLDDYEDGRAAGLRMFCKPSRGYIAGSKGHSYDGVCPGDLENDYLQAYEDGRILYLLNEEVNRSEKAIDSVEKHIDNLEHDIEKAERDLVSDDNDRQGRKELLDDIKQMSQELENLHYELIDLEDELESRRNDVQEYKLDAPVY